MDINDLKKGTIFSFDKKNYKVLEVSHSHIGRGGAVVQAKIKDIKTGNVLNRNFKPSDELEEIDLEKKKLVFLFSHRDKYHFADPEDKSKRFQFSKEELKEKTNFLKPNLEVESLWVDDEFIDLVLPPKIDLKVVEAPPNFKGDTAQGGTKEVITETGLKVKVPMFIKEGEIIRVNTETGEYTERVKS